MFRSEGEQVRGAVELGAGQVEAADLERVLDAVRRDAGRGHEHQPDDRHRAPPAQRERREPRVEGAHLLRGRPRPRRRLVGRLPPGEPREPEDRSEDSPRSRAARSTGSGTAPKALSPSARLFPSRRRRPCDGDRRFHPGVRHAVVVDRARLRHLDGARLVVADEACVERAVRGRRRVCNPALVEERDSVADLNGQRPRLVAPLLDVRRLDDRDLFRRCARLRARLRNLSRCARTRSRWARARRTPSLPSARARSRRI